MNGIARYFDHRYEVCDRFTHRARLVMAVADQFALEQGAKEIGPEHVLRGLASVDYGVGRAVLADLDIDLFKLLPEIVELLPRQSRDLGSERDFGDTGRALLAASRKAAATLEHQYIGTEHLVLGMLAEPSPASDFLKKRGATYNAAFEGVKRLVGAGS